MHNIDEIDMEQSWAHVLHALHGEAHSPQALAEAAALSRHEAAGHIAVIDKGVPAWKVFGVIALVAVGLFGAVAVMNRLGTDAKISSAVNASDARVVTSLPAQVGVVTLDDGSTVRLAPESKLTIPKTFGATMRAVKIEGAGTFTVAKGQAENFRVYGRNAIVTATGTVFTVRAYESDPAMTVVVEEGTVSVSRGDDTQSLKAGESLVVERDKALRSASSVESEEAAGWTMGTLAVSNRPLRDVLPQLRRWYGLSVNVPSDALLDRPVTMRASLDSSRQAIRAIEQSTGLEFGYIGQNMVFREPASASGKKK